MSLKLVASSKGTNFRVVAKAIKWLCESIKDGINVLPCKSIISVSLFFKANTSSFVPIFLLSYLL